MKKKIISCIISLLMVILLLQPAYSVLAASSVWTGGIAIPALSGGYYQISTAENLAWFARQVNNGSSSIKARLTDDIMLNSTGYFTYEWTPIGTESNPFRGEFDGNGHYISGVYIRTQREYNGLFGYVYTARPNVDDEDDSTEEIFVANPPVMIHNVEVRNSQIAGLDNTGGVCGYIHYGVIENCSYSGTITSTGNSVGGVCGTATIFSRIKKCYSKGSVAGVIRTGGVVGFAESNCQLSECYSEASVRSNASVNGNTGGIVGALSYGTLKGCYFMGSVTGPKRIGGIIGYNSYSSIVSCYVLGAVSSTTGATEYVNSIAGYSMGCTYYNCYFCEDETGRGDPNGTARTVADMKKFSFVRELNENASAFSFDYMDINNGLPVLVFMLETSVWAGGVEEPDMDSSGWYIIKTPDNLAWFSKLVNGTLAGVERNSSAKARVMDNLLLNIFITDDTSLTNEFTPIGSETYPFTGTFNGNGYNIAGVYVNGAKNQGLFGYIGTGGSVSGVVMIDGEINGTENVGAVAGYNKGTISTSCNDGVVNGQKAVGGICGYNVGTVQTSYNVGTVDCVYEGGSQIGGICGYNTRATINQCYNNGFVTGVANSNYYGGICGSNSGDGIYNCYNAGEILGGFYIGGLVGYNSTGTIKYCLNHGIVNTLNQVNSNVNNFIGYNYGTCTTQYCYIDNTIENTVINNLNGAVAKTTAELTGGSISYTLSLQSGKWSNKYDDDYFRYYPQIYDLCYSSYAKYKEDSLDSVRVVKDSFNVKLKIDGEADTYYADFPAAFNALNGRNGSAIPIRNISLDQTVNVETRVAVHGEGHPVTVTRAAGFTGSLFNVTGTGMLILGDSKDGSDENPLLIIDGNNEVSGAGSVITVGENGTMNTYKGWKITGANASARGAAVYMDSNSTFTMHGGVITENSTTLDAGAVYNDMGTFSMDGGEISTNTSTGTSSKAGAVYINSGIMNFSGGVIYDNYGKTYGGGIYVAGADSEVTISDSALLKGNYANAGGGILINYGTVTMTGGEISSNYAYKKHGSTAVTGGGGGVAINTNGRFSMSGGVIKDNYVYNNAGAGFGVTVFGTFEMSADALITNNDVFVAKNRTIAVTGKLNAEGTAAVITPATYATTTVVLSGESMGLGSTKFEVTPSGTTAWYVNSAGYLMNTPIQNVASLSKFGAYAVDYVSVAQAVNAVAAGESGIITIIADNTINETIKVYGDVTILSETDQTFTSMRGGSFKGALFEVQPGATLTFGFTEAEKQGEDVSADDEEALFTTDSVGGEYILDGGYAYNQATGSSMITVKAGGTLVTYDDFTMANGYSTSGGSIAVSGVMNMYGGTFRNNTAVNGGAINVASTGTLNLLGGCITGNNVTASTGHGKAIYCAGTIYRSENVYEYYQDNAVVATRNTYVNITPDNDVYLLSTKVLNINSVVTDVLLSGTSTPPESVTVSASPMVLSAPIYYEGMPMLAGDDIGLHYSEFSISDTGYYIIPDGTIGFRLLTPVSDSGLNIDRTAQIITGFDTSKTVSYYKTQFLDSENVIFRDADLHVMSDDSTLTTGSTISLRSPDGTQIFDTAAVVIYGDVDCDGFIDAMDAMLIYCIAQNMFADGDLTQVQLKAADIDGSGIDASDAQYVESCGIKLNTVDQNI